MLIVREISCYYCKYLKDKGDWYKRFECKLDDEVLNEFNLKLTSCNCFEEKTINNV